MPLHAPFVDFDLSSGNRVTAAWLNGVNSAIYDALNLRSGTIVRTADEKLAEFVDVRDYAVPNGTDVTVGFQAALDSALEPDLPLLLMMQPSILGYGITSVRYKNSYLILAGAGGQAKINYVGTAAAAGEMFILDKVTDHQRFNPDLPGFEAENYKGVKLIHLYLDGKGLALRGMNLNGATRSCQIIGCRISGCVNPIKLDDCYYLGVDGLHLDFTPKTNPGMDAGVYSANLFGLVANICHEMEFRRLIMDNIGGNSSNQYSAALRFTSCEGVTIVNPAVEAMQRVANERYIARALDAQGGTSLTVLGGFVEQVEGGDEILHADENSLLNVFGTHFNNIKGARFLTTGKNTPVSMVGVEGTQFVLTDRLIKELNDEGILYGVSLQNCMFPSGVLTGTVHADAGVGLPCDTLAFDSGPGANETQVRGYKKWGLDVSVSGTTKLRCTAGAAIMGGNGVQLVKNSTTVQEISPDVVFVGDWYAKLSSAGNFFCEKTSVSLAGSGSSLLLATFSTNGSAITDLVLVETGGQRLAGEIGLPGSLNSRLPKLLSGERAMTLDNTDYDLIKLSLSSAAGEDDEISFDGFWQITSAVGATNSPECGRVSGTWFQDDSANRPATVTPTKYGTNQGLDAGQASMTITFATTLSGRDCTLKVKNATATTVGSRVVFHIQIIGGRRATSRAVLADGVTPLV